MRESQPNEEGREAFMAFLDEVDDSAFETEFIADPELNAWANEWAQVV